MSVGEGRLTRAELQALIDAIGAPQAFVVRRTLDVIGTTGGKATTEQIHVEPSFRESVK